MSAPIASSSAAAAPSVVVLWKVTGLPLTEIWSTWSLPLVRSPARVGTKRYTNELGCLTPLDVTLPPPTSSMRIRLPSLSLWMPS